MKKQQTKHAANVQRMTTRLDARSKNDDSGRETPLGSAAQAPGEAA